MLCGIKVITYIFGGIVAKNIALTKKGVCGTKPGNCFHDDYSTFCVKTV